MEDLNLHFTGDIHAVGVANNLLAAMIDTHIMHGNELDIDPFTISWRRVVDLNDRACARSSSAWAARSTAFPRETGYDITVASEVMAILGLATCSRTCASASAASSSATARTGKPLTAEDINAAGAMAVLLKDALKPNLMQTLEDNPAFVHAGPFANIAQGNNSIIADQVAMKLADYVVTESGFGADLGAEKFMDIICRYGGFAPSAVVITCTMRALKMHGGLPADKELLKAENNAALEKGCENLEKQIENMKLFGIPVVVTINRFDFDRDARDRPRAQAGHGGRRRRRHPDRGACQGRRRRPRGGRGGLRGRRQAGDFHFLYELDAPIKEKIETIATKIYGADGVDYLPAAEEKIKLYTDQGLDKLPICMAKTHLSLRHDPRSKVVRGAFACPSATSARRPAPASSTRSRRDAHHARPAQAAGGGRRRHRRQHRQHRRPVLRLPQPDRGQAARGAAPSRGHSRRAPNAVCAGSSWPSPSPSEVAVTRESATIDTAKEPLQTYLDDAASGRPAPGGGSVSACAGAPAPRWSAMVGNLTARQEKFAAVDAQPRGPVSRSEEARARASSSCCRTTPWPTTA